VLDDTEGRRRNAVETGAFAFAVDDDELIYAIALRLTSRAARALERVIVQRVGPVLAIYETETGRHRTYLWTIKEPLEPDDERVQLLRSAVILTAAECQIDLVLQQWKPAARDLFMPIREDGISLDLDDERYEWGLFPWVQNMLDQRAEADAPKGFAKVENAIADSTLPLATKGLYLLLARHCYGNKNWCVPGIATLCRLANATDKTVKGHVRRLVEAGFLKVIDRGGPATNYYKLTLRPDPPKKKVVYVSDPITGKAKRKIISE
jgi:hypothetical protein